MSITYETPGVYIEEITGPGVIQGVSTSVVGFVGPTARGTSTEAVQVTSFDQFVERFTAPGAAHRYYRAEEPVYLWFALQGFFQNGGRRAHIARVSNGDTASAELLNADDGVEAIVRAREEGIGGNEIRVRTQPSSRTWKLAAPAAFVVTQRSPNPPPEFPCNDPRVLELSSGTAGFAVGDSVRVAGPPAAPVVDNPGDQRTPVGEDVDLLLSASSMSGGPLTFTASGLPSPLQIDAAGRITGRPTASGPPATVTVTATDGAQSTDITFTWEVFQPAPTITSPGQQTNNTGDQVNLQIQAQSQTPTPGTLTYTLAGQNELSIDANGLITGQLTTPGVFDVSVTITEGSAQATTRFAWIIPAPVLAVVERTDMQWLLIAGHSGVVLEPDWPGGISPGATVGLVDYGPAETQIRLEPVPPELLPAVGTWIEAGSGPDAVRFRVRRATSNGVITADRREPSDKTISIRVHRDLSSMSFDLHITSATKVTTVIEDLSLDPISERFLLAEGAITSDVVVVEEPRLPLFNLPRRIGVSSFRLTGGADFELSSLGSDDYRRAIDLLERVDEVSMVCVPDAARYDEGRSVTRRTIQAAQLGHCLRMADRIAIFDPPQTPPNGERPEDQIRNVINDLRSTRGFGVVYYPWLRVQDPRSTAQRPLTMLIPPSGHIAGVLARTDMTRGVFKAPANVTIDEVLGVERKLTDGEQAPLNVAGVNVLRILPGSNRVTVWGARTTVDPFVTDWLYVNVRRLLLFLEESIQDGIRWAVFEPNDLGLWKSLHRVITAFLREQWQAGALFGAREEEAFRVRIDEALNPPSTRNKGYLYIEIKVAPVRPAEFIVVRISLFDGGADVEEV